jgi:hypothetical protein
MENKIIDGEFQEGFRQDELIGGEPSFYSISDSDSESNQSYTVEDRN